MPKHKTPAQRIRDYFKSREYIKKLEEDNAK